MKRYALAAVAVALMSGSAMAYPAHSFKRPPAVKSIVAPALTPYERVQIRRSQSQLYLLERRAKADGRVTFLERWRIQLAQKRHNALVYRLTHN